MNAAGYSGTPLVEKLGYRPGDRAYVRGAPEGYEASLQPIPDGVRFMRRLTGNLDLIHIFAKRRRELERSLSDLQKRIRPDGVIWISWPKKASLLPSDVNGDVVRGLALPLGLVDVKVCAVDEVWSGLKLVIRKELRSG